MDQTNLTPAEEQQLRDACAGIPEDLKDDFCKCWPVVKGMLEQIRSRLPDGKLKEAIGRVIWAGDWICRG